FQVIHVQVGEQDVDPRRKALAHELVAETAVARPRVEHQHRVVGQPEIHARRVPAVPDGVGPGGCKRPPAAPDRCLHEESSQNSPSAPTNSSAWANSGIAVTDTLRRSPSAPVMVKEACAGTWSVMALASGRSSRGRSESSSPRGSNIATHFSLGSPPTSGYER